LSLFLHRRDSRQRLTERCCDTAAKKKLLFLFDKAVCPKLTHNHNNDNHNNNVNTNNTKASARQRDFTLARATAHQKANGTANPVFRTRYLLRLPLPLGLELREKGAASREEGGYVARRAAWAGRLAHTQAVARRTQCSGIAPVSERASRA
jgi:hypothetical protein